MRQRMKAKSWVPKFSMRTEVTGEGRARMIVGRGAPNHQTGIPQKWVQVRETNMAKDLRPPLQAVDPQQSQQSGSSGGGGGMWERWKVSWKAIETAVLRPKTPDPKVLLAKTLEPKALLWKLLEVLVKADWSSPKS